MRKTTAKMTRAATRKDDDKYKWVEVGVAAAQREYTQKEAYTLDNQVKNLERVTKAQANLIVTMQHQLHCAGRALQAMTVPRDLHLYDGGDM
jgi:phage-related tail protein